MESSVRPPDPAQRLALREHPGRRPVMFQSWEQLLFLHWSVDPEAVQATLPPGLWVDCHQGQAHVGLVPFYMRRVRPRFLPAMPHFSWFLECNVRTYVHDADGVPGVWFLSLDTNRWLAYRLARQCFHLPYFWARMRASTRGRETLYEVRRRGMSENAVFQYASSGEPALAEPGTLDFFLLERYLLFACDPGSGRLFRGQVHHAPYRASPARVLRHSTAPLRWDGLPEIEGDPVHQCFVDRVDVEIFPLEGCAQRVG